MNQYKLKIFKDTSGVTWAYDLFSITDNESVMYSDGYNSPEELKKDLTKLQEALTVGLGSVEIKSC